MAKDFDLAAVMADIEASPFDWTAGETALTRMTEAERDHRLGVPLPSKAEVARRPPRCRSTADGPHSRRPPTTASHCRPRST